MGKHSAETDFDLVSLTIGREVPQSHRALDEDVLTMPIALPLLPAIPVASSEHHGVTTGCGIRYAKTKVTPVAALAGLLGVARDYAPRYRRGVTEDGAR